MAAQFLAVGHVVKDVVGNGWRLGGSVAYAVRQASRLGLQTAAVTACAPDVSPAELLPETQWHVLADHETTTFENLYQGGARRQRVLARARVIGPAQVPGRWRSTPIVFLAPVLWDLEPNTGSVFPEECLVGLGAQGWLRQLQGSEVRPGSVDQHAPWLYGDIIFVSEEDLEEPERAAEWLAYVPMVVLTRGRGGATVFDDAGRHDFPAFLVPEVDPTGAGDVFAAAFLARWRETSDLEETARFASAAAALSLRGAGLDAIASRAEIEALMAATATGGAR
jgi:1D-myo-inositol 3-kinase